MATINAFNDMMAQFLNELVLTFPQEPAMKKYRNSFDMFKDTNPKKIMEVFVNGITPYSQQVTQRDEKFFLDNKIEIISDLNITKYWNDDLSSSTKNAIWDYLNTLWAIGSTICSLPADSLDQIETIAKQMAEGLQNGDGDAMNNMMSGIQNIVKSMGRLSK